MGDAKAGPVCLSFNPQLRVEFSGATVTSDAGLLLPRELAERLGLSALIERHLSDPRTGYNRQFPLPDLFRQSIYSRLAGYEDTNDAERLAEDPTFRMLASRERRASSVALTSTLHWFETEVLTEEDNHQGLARLNTALVQRAATVTGRVTLDIDSSESPVHGARAGGVQWPLRVRLLPSALRLQSEGRLPGRQAPTGQRPQCARVGGGPPARH
jgi:hypothetical protein